MSNKSGWIVRSSFKYDLFGFLSAISHNNFHNRFYPTESKRWQEALGNLIPEGERLIGGISMSYLGNLFFLVQAETIDEIIFHLEDMSTLEREVKAKAKNDYISVLNYLLSDSISRKELIDVIKALKENGYPEYWQTEIKPIVEQKCDELEAKLSQYSVEGIITDVDTFLGTGYQSETHEITIYLAYFNLPVSYALPCNQSVHSFSKTDPINETDFVSTLVHELLHKFKPGDELKSYYKELLEKDKFFAEKHDYLINKMMSGENEDYVIAAEAYLAEKLGVASRHGFYDKMERSNGASTVLAPIVYSQLIAQEGSGGNYDKFLIELFQNKTIEAGKVEEQFWSSLEKMVGRSAVLSAQIFDNFHQNFDKLIHIQEQLPSSNIAEQFLCLLKDFGFQSLSKSSTEIVKVGIKEFSIIDFETACHLDLISPNMYKVGIDMVKFSDNMQAKKIWAESARGQWYSGMVHSDKGIWIFYTIKTTEGNTITATWIHDNWFISTNVFVPITIDPDFDSFHQNAVQMEEFLKTVKVLDQVINVYISANSSGN